MVAEQSVPREIWRRAPLSIGDLFLLIAPALQFLQFRSTGLVFATDILLLLALPLVLARSVRRLKQKQIALILMLALAWLASQVLTDLIRHSRPDDYLRGWSKIVLTITHFSVIWVALRDSMRRFVLYGIGFSIGGVLAASISPSPEAFDEPWKFGFAVPATLAVIIIATLLSSGRKRSIVLFALVAMSALNLYMNFRSLGLICLATGIYSYFQMHLGGRRRLGRLQMVVAGAAVLLSIWAFQQMYLYGLEQGWLGQEAQAKYEIQQQGSGGLVLGGRSEILASAQAIIDSPFIGHGSWARDPKYAALMRERKAELGYKKGWDDQDDLIPTHSHILGAWVEAGVVGAIFWFWLLKLAVSTLLRATGAEPLLPVFAFMAVLLCWDIIFSPYAAERRFVTTYFIAGISMLRSLTARMQYARTRVSS
jgi:hypothetical protein